MLKTGLIWLTFSLYENLCKTLLAKRKHHAQLNRLPNPEQSDENGSPNWSSCYVLHRASSGKNLKAKFPLRQLLLPPLQNIYQSY